MTAPAPPPDTGAATAADRLLTAWVAAFNAADLPAIVGLYDPQALLWGTTAQAVIASRAGVEGYFRAVFGLRPAPQVQVTDRVARAFGDTVVVAGAYTLSVPEGDTLRPLPARFSFTLQGAAAGPAAPVAGRILGHHSSLWPSAPLAAAAPDTTTTATPT